MQAVLMQELAEVRRRDTDVSVPGFRRHRLRAVPRPADRASVDSNEASPEGAFAWADPGDTLQQGTAIAVILREAIVRRNHRPEPKRARAAILGSTAIDWARSADRQVSVKRVGRGALRISGRSSALARVSIGVDGLAFTVAIPPHASPAAAIAERLRAYYQVEIVEEADGSYHVAVRAPLPHT